MTSILEYYSRKDIQKFILECAKDKEVAVRFGDKGFGKRPDVLQFENDIYELAKQGATSFHFSEELWKNPLLLKAGMTKNELDQIRKGWDLIIDLDSKHLEFSKLAAFLIVEALKFHNIKNISVKFSGNKGFHIAIPFETFPKIVNDENIVDMFPEGPKIIADYLKHMMESELEIKILENYSMERILEITGNKKEDILHKVCRTCKSNVNEDLFHFYKCKICGAIEESKEEKEIQCHLCKADREHTSEEIIKCSECGEEYNKRTKKDLEFGNFNPFSLVDIDTLLISSRHMFRAPYSYHEKSGLISLPINPSDILTFDKDKAKIENVKPNLSFLSRKEIVENGSSTLLIQAFDWNVKNKIKEVVVDKNRKYEIPKIAIKEDFFPPCIKLLLEGVKKDGRKRGIFILTSFLRGIGYNYDQIEEVLLKWNQGNYTPLADNYIKTQLDWSRKKDQGIPPQNCPHASKKDNVYTQLNICNPDNFCKLIKNPLQYAKRKSIVWKGKK